MLLAIGKYIQDPPNNTGGLAQGECSFFSRYCNIDPPVKERYKSKAGISALEIYSQRRSFKSCSVTGVSIS